MAKSLPIRRYLSALFILLLPIMLARVSTHPRSVIWSDCEGYYKYLPTVFILQDVHKMPAGSVHHSGDGEYVDKYTCGVAYFQAPFYLLTLMAAHPSQWGEDAIFNDPYAFSVAFAGYFIGFLGLFFLQKILRRHFEEKVVFWTLMSVFLGTNLFHYTTREMGMSHVYSFALVSFIVWHVPIFYKKPDLKNALLLGAAFGWLVLIRPTNILIGLFILLYEVYTVENLRARFRFWKTQFRLVPVIALAGIIFWLPQFWYWYEMTGSWFWYSYQGEGFIYWREPKIAAVLLDPQNGLFIYTPMALLMFRSLVYSFKKRTHSAPALILIFILSTYFFASWWAWWFGGAFGARAYVELFALLALPLAGVYQKIFLIVKKWLKYLTLAGCAFLIYYSVRLSFLYSNLPTPWDGSDWRWNWDKVFWIWKHLF